MTAARQAAMYHARRRRRSLRAIPHLFRTHLAPRGASASHPFAAHQLQEPVSFRTKFTVGVLGPVFSVGTSVVVSQTASFVQITVGGKTFNVVPQEAGDWEFVLAFRPDLQVRAWNQYGEVLKDVATSFPGGNWAGGADVLTADDDLLEGVGAYVAQLPQHFIDTVVAVAPDTTDILFNSTALFFNPDFPTPRFEDSPTP